VTVCRWVHYPGTEFPYVGHCPVGPGPVYQEEAPDLSKPCPFCNRPIKMVTDNEIYESDAERQEET
jgi:transcription initiation factor IIE alpha subunit